MFAVVLKFIPPSHGKSPTQPFHCYLSRNRLYQQIDLDMIPEVITSEVSLLANSHLNSLNLHFFIYKLRGMYTTYHIELL